MKDESKLTLTLFIGKTDDVTGARFYTRSYKKKKKKHH